MESLTLSVFPIRNIHFVAKRMIIHQEWEMTDSGNQSSQERGAMLNRREFSRIVSLGLPISAFTSNLFSVAAEDARKRLNIGPVLGHIDERRIFCFIRAPREGEVLLVLSDEEGDEISRTEIRARARLYAEQLMEVLLAYD